MGKKDVISKEILKNIARDIATHILKIEVRDDMELINQNLTRIESRDADVLFKNGNDIIHIEVQNDHHPKMHLRMGRYYMDILFLHENYNVRQYMLYIGKKRCYMKSKITRDKIDYSYDIIDMRDMPCELFLYSNDSSALVLAMLCDFEGKDKQIVVNTILKKLRELNDDREYRNYIKMVNVYSTNRGLEKEVEKGMKMLTVDLEKTPLYKIGNERGIQTGIETGIEKGIEKGVLLVAKQMLKLNMDMNVIQQVTNLSIEKLNGIKKELDSIS